MYISSYNCIIYISSSLVKTYKYILWHMILTARLENSHFSCKLLKVHISSSLGKSVHFLETIFMKFAACRLSGSKCQGSYAHGNHLTPKENQPRKALQRMVVKHTCQENLGGDDRTRGDWRPPRWPERVGRHSLSYTPASGPCWGRLTGLRIPRCRATCTTLGPTGGTGTEK